MVLTLVFTLVGASNPSFAASSYSSSSSAPNDISSESNDSIEPPRLLQGSLSSKIRSDSEIYNYFSSNADIFGFDQPKSDLQVVEKEKDSEGKEHYLLQQHYKGIPVYGMYIRTHLDTSQKIYAITNESAPELNQLTLDTTPSLNSNQAVDALKAEIESSIGATISLGGNLGPRKLNDPQTELIIYPFEDAYYLAYRIEIEYIDPSFDRWVGFVDANTGAVLKKFSKMVHVSSETNQTGTGPGYYNETRTVNVSQESDGRYYLLDRTKPMYNADLDTGVIATYDYKKFFNGPVSSNTRYFNDPEAVDAHYFSGIVYDYYLNQLQRNSFDDKGASIYNFVNFGLYDNAFWDGYQMVYGSGESSFECLSCALDVVAHEMTHGVIEYSANLEYVSQSGALNESLADIMAVVIDSDDWIIGEDTGIIDGSRLLRDLQDPARGLTPQPAHMNDYVLLSEDEDNDNGGVHINSGIPNHAAYLIGTGIDTVSGLQGQGKKLLGQIAYGAMTSYLTPTSDFADARDAFVLSAGDLDITDAQKSEVVRIVKNAWKAVGLDDTTGENNIVSFRVPGMLGSPVINKEAHTVTFEIGYGDSLNGLEPDISVSPGAALTPGANVPQDFSEPVTYTVKSASGIDQVWSIVGSIMDPASMNDITSFEVEAQSGPAIIDPVDHTVMFYLEESDDITALRPVIEVSEGAVLSGASTDLVNFMSPQVYTVTAQDGTVQQWTVTCIRDSASPKLFYGYATSNTTVELIFDDAMNIGSLSDKANYELQSMDSAYPNALVTGVFVDCLQPNKVVLTTSNLVSDNAYRISVSNITSTSGYTVRPDWNFGYFLVDDTAPPELLTARISGTQLVLDFDEYISSAISTQSAFEVVVNDSDVPVSQMQTSSKKVTLTLAERVQAEDKVAVSFSPLNAQMQISDMNGNASLGFANKPVINRTADTIPLAGHGWFHYGQSLQQVIKHPQQPVLYMIFKDNKQVISYNTETGEIKTITMQYQPERLFYRNNELFVGLVHQNHSSYWWEEDQTGTIAILDANLLSLTTSFDVNIDPYDLVVDNNGFIYVSSGSGQWTNFDSYSRDTKEVIQRANISQASYVQLSPTQNKLYTINTDLSPRDIRAYSVNNNGQFTEALYPGGYDSPYHGDYDMSTLLRVSPDGNYLFNGAGTIFNSSTNEQQDMTYVRTIAAFKDIVFNLDHDKFYTINDNILRVYQYSSFELLDELTMSRAIAGILPVKTANQLLMVLSENGGDSTTVTEYFIPTDTELTLQASNGAAGSIQVLVPATPNACTVQNPGSGDGGLVIGGGDLPLPEEAPDTGSPSVILDADSIQLDRKTSEQGETSLQVKPDASKLLSAIKSAQSGAEQYEKEHKQPAVPKVSIKVSDLADSVNVEVPASLFIEANEAAPETILSVESGSVIYELPIQLLQTDSLKKALGSNINISSLTVKLTIEQPDDKLSGQVKKSIADDGYRAVTDSFAFILSVGSGESYTEIADFNGTYVTRSITISESESSNKLSALVYDPVTGETSFVPAVVRTEDGKTMVDIKSPHNSIYTVVQASKTFNDVSKHWAKTDIETMASKKIVIGITEQQFQPEKQITRAEFSAILVRALGLSLPQANDRFNDIRSTDWHARSVAAAANSGLITGYANGTFVPNGTITRQEMAVMLGRAISFAQSHENNASSNPDAGNKLAMFSDSANIPAWAVKDIEHMLAAGIMQGVTANTFEPAAPVTRAQATVALRRMLQHLTFIN